MLCFTNLINTWKLRALLSFSIILSSVLTCKFCSINSTWEVFTGWVCVSWLLEKLLCAEWGQSSGNAPFDHTPSTARSMHRACYSGLVIYCKKISSRQIWTISRRENVWAKELNLVSFFTSLEMVFIGGAKWIVHAGGQMWSIVRAVWVQGVLPVPPLINRTKGHYFSGDGNYCDSSK